VSTSDSKAWFEVDFRGRTPRGGIKVDEYGAEDCLRPEWGVFSWIAPPAWKMRIPNVTVSPTFQCVARAYSVSVNRVNVWVPAFVVPDEQPLPALEIELRSGAAVASTDEVQLTLAKGLTTLAVNPFFVQLSGLSAELWSLWARTIGPAARDVSVGFAMIAGRAKCCARTVTST
jgi:hypothetical protein